MSWIFLCTPGFHFIHEIEFEVCGTFIEFLSLEFAQMENWMFFEREVILSQKTSCQGKGLGLEIDVTGG